MHHTYILYEKSDGKINTILQNIIGPLAGVMAALVFWYMARNLDQPMVRNHIMLQEVSKEQ
jgi:hypothetical protein